VARLLAAMLSTPPPMALVDAMLQMLAWSAMLEGEAGARSVEPAPAATNAYRTG
jgi:hypothetical protein